MKIERVAIDGFGEYADARLPVFDKPVTILHGPNEAGKSTLLAFVRAILFGFPLRGGAAHFPPLSGGNHGGRLDVVSDAGERFTVERYQGTRGGQVSVTSAGGAAAPESTLARILGHAPRTTFESVFAFDLDELQDLDSADDSGIGSQIYSAGTGAARLPQALKQLGDRADALYAQRGSKQPIARTLAELQELETQLRNAQSQSEEYGAALAGLERLETDSAALEGERKLIGAEVDQLNRTASSWDAWLALMEVRDRLAEIPELTDFPEDAVSRLDALKLRQSEAKNDVESLESELARARESAGVGIDGEGLLDEAKAIESIQLDRTNFAGFLDSIPHRQGDLAAIKSDLARELGKLGVGWSEEKLKEFDASVPQRDKVRQWDSQLAEARDAVRSADDATGRAADSLDEATTQHQARLLKLEAANAPNLSLEQIRVRQSAVTAGKSRLGDYQLEVRLADQRRHDAEARATATPFSRTAPRSNAMILPIALAMLGGLAIVGGAVFGQWLAIVMGAALVGASGFVWLTSRGTDVPLTVTTRDFPPAPDNSEAADEKLRAFFDAIQPLELGLAISEIPERDRLDAVDSELTDAAESQRDYIQLASAERDAVSLVEQRQKQLDDAMQRGKEQFTVEERAQAEWRDWLTIQQLSETIDPRTTLELMVIAETARAFAGAAESMRGRISGIEREIGEYSARVAPLAERFLGLSASLDPSATASAADELVRHLTEARTAATDHADALRVAEDCEARFSDAVQRRTSIEEEIAALLSQGGTSDPEDLRRLAISHKERRGLVQDERAHAENIRGVWGRDVDLANLGSMFKATTREATAEKLENARIQLDEMDAEIKALSQQRGELLTKMEQLSSDKETSRLRAHREELIEELRTLADEWSKITIAKTMLLKARSRYEEERQPDVVKRARKLFEILTGGRYSKLQITIGEQEITVIEDGKSAKTPAQLSRGTREQLYLALRFGLIQSMGDNAESLPVIVDEVLVNFDPERAKRAAEAFVELSRTNQVLVLTCHPQTVQLFQEATGGEATVIDLSKIQAGP